MRERETLVGEQLVVEPLLDVVTDKICKHYTRKNNLLKTLSNDTDPTQHHYLALQQHQG